MYVAILMIFFKSEVSINANVVIFQEEDFNLLAYGTWCISDVARSEKFQTTTSAAKTTTTEINEEASIITTDTNEELSFEA